MELRHEFEVASEVEETWRTLTDLERLSRCVPGFEMSEVDGEEYRGSFKVGVGPLSGLYRGGAQFEEVDALRHRAVLSAGGRDRNGNGNARAVITAQLAKSDGGTSVTLATELTLTGDMLRLGPEMVTGAAEVVFAGFLENLHRTLLPPPAISASPVGMASAEAADVTDASSAAESVRDPRAGATDSRADDSVGRRRDRVRAAALSVGGRLRPVVTLAALVVIVAEAVCWRRSAAGRHPGHPLCEGDITGL